MNQPPRLALALLHQAARRWPAELRDDLHREWLAELYAIADDPDAAGWARGVRAVRFGASLAVRRPAPATAARVPVTGIPSPAAGSAGRLFGVTFGVVVLGTAVAMLLAAVPGIVLASHGPDVGQLSSLLAGPLLIAVGAVAGRRVARRVLPDGRGPVRLVLPITAAVLCAQLLPLFGEGVTGLLAVAVWAVGLLAMVPLVARLAGRPRGPLPWLAVALGGVVLVDLATTATVGLALGSRDVYWAYAAAWFPVALFESATPVVVGPPGMDDAARFAIVDGVELLPHALLVATAFAVCLVAGATRRRATAEAGA